MAHIVEALAVEQTPARYAERQSIVSFIRKRAESALSISRRSPDLLPEVEALRLERWLGALADDIDQQLHDDD